MIGFILNAAVPPLHAWLPDAYGEATFNGSVFLCAFTTKTAVYALCRGFAGMEILVVLGVIMALYGVVYAVLENDCRRLLAYHIISQVGYMVAGVGLGTQMAINGACAHAFAHILYKGLLFMGCGSVLLHDRREQVHRAGRAVEEDAVDVRLHPDRRLVHLRLPALQRVRQQVDDHQRRHGGAQILGRHAAAARLRGNVPAHRAEGALLHLVREEQAQQGSLGPRRRAAVEHERGDDRCRRALHLHRLLHALPLQDAAVSDGGRGVSSLHRLPHLRDLQILLFTGLGFFLLLKKLVPDPTISLDLDWFYRKGWRVFLWVARKPVQAADTFVGELYRVAGLVPLMVSARVAALFDNEVIDGRWMALLKASAASGAGSAIAQRGQMQQNLAFAFAVAAVLILAFLWYSNALAR